MFFIYFLLIIFLAFSSDAGNICEPTPDMLFIWGSASDRAAKGITEVEIEGKKDCYNVPGVRRINRNNIKHAVSAAATCIRRHQPGKKRILCFNKVIAIWFPSANYNAGMATKEMPKDIRGTIYEKCKDIGQHEPFDVLYFCMRNQANQLNLRNDFDKKWVSKYFWRAATSYQSALKVHQICKDDADFTSNTQYKWLCNCQSISGNTCKNKFTLKFKFHKHFVNNQIPEWLFSTSKSLKPKPTPGGSGLGNAGTGPGGGGAGEVPGADGSKDEEEASSKPSDPNEAEDIYEDDDDDDKDDEPASPKPSKPEDIYEDDDDDDKDEPASPKPSEPEDIYEDDDYKPGGTGTSNNDGGTHEAFTGDGSGSGIEGDIPKYPCDLTLRTWKGRITDETKTFLNQAASNYIMIGLVNSLQKQINNRPYYGSLLAKELTKFGEKCGNENISKFPIFKEFIEKINIHSITSTTQKDYFAVLTEAATELVNIDKQSAILLSDYRGMKGTKDGEGFRAIMSKIERKWSSGAYQLIPCRSILTLVNIAISQIAHYSDENSQCEMFAGVTISNLRRKDAMDYQRLVCSSTTSSTEACMQSCNLYKSSDNKMIKTKPSDADALLACMRQPLVDEGHGFVLDKRSKLPLFSKTTASYYISKKIDSSQFEVYNTPRQRCELKEAVLASLAAIRGTILSSYPELSQKIKNPKDDTLMIPIYQELIKYSSTTNWPESIKSKIGSNYISGLTKEGGGLGIVIERLCKEPEEAAKMVWLSTEHKNNFLSCRHHNLNLPLPIPTKEESSENQECDQIRIKGPAICKISKDLYRSEATKKQALFSLSIVLEAFDPIGCVTMFFPIVSAARVGIQSISAIGKAGLTGARTFATQEVKQVAVSRARILAGESLAVLRMSTHKAGVAGLAYASQLPKQIPIIAVFTGFGIYSAVTAERDAERFLAETVASCYAFGESCETIGDAQHAYNQARAQTWGKIIKHSILGALVPGGKLHKAELAAALKRIKTARIGFMKAAVKLQKKISTSNQGFMVSQGQRLATAKKSFRNIFIKHYRNVFCRGKSSCKLPVRNLETGKVEEVDIKQITSDDAEALMSLSKQIEPKANAPHVMEPTPLVVVSPKPKKPLTPDIRKKLYDLNDGDLIPDGILSEFDHKAIAEVLIERYKAKQQAGGIPLIEEADIYIAVEPETVPKIAKSGFIGNIHQFGTTRHTKTQYSPMRFELENELLGIQLEGKYQPGPTHTPNHFRPISTFLNPKDGLPQAVGLPDGITVLETYGNNIIVLKPDVKKRSLWTPGDSGLIKSYELGGRGKPIKGNAYGTKPAFKFEDGTNTNGYTSPYRENIVFGGVTVDDIAHVLVPENTPKKIMQEQANSLQVPCQQYRIEKIIDPTNGQTRMKVVEFGDPVQPDIYEP